MLHKLIRNYFNSLLLSFSGGDGGGSSRSGPDTSALTSAANNAGQLGAELGKLALEQNQKQYDLNMSVAKPIIDAQAGLMRQQIQQGNDYFDRQQAVKPLETAMLNEVSGLSPTDYKNLQFIKDYKLAQANSSWQDTHGKAVTDFQKQLDALQKERDTYLDSFKGATGTDSTPGATSQDPIMSFQQFQSMGGNTDLSKGIVAPYNNDNPAASYADYVAKASNARYSSGTPGLAAAQADPEKLKDYDTRLGELRRKLDSATGEKFDPRSADMSAYDRIAAMDTQNGREAKAALEQAKRDTILSLKDVAGQEELDRQDRNTLMLGRGELYQKDKANIDDMIGTAVADSRAGYTRAIGQVARQGLRYGLSPEAIASQEGSLGLVSASQQASAANSARNAGVDDFRQRVANNYGARQNDFSRAVGLKRSVRDMEIQDNSLGWAKSLDVLGNAKGNAGLSQGAYSIANQSGNSAVNNQIVPSQAFMSNIASANNAQMQGSAQKIAGLQSVLSSENSTFNTNTQAAASANAGKGQMTGSLIGAGAPIAAAFI